MAVANEDMRFAALLSQLTLEEKVTLLSGRKFNTTPEIPRLGIPQIKVCEPVSTNTSLITCMLTQTPGCRLHQWSSAV
jgi:hypothetical protein